MNKVLACLVGFALLNGCSSGEQCQEVLGAKCIQCHGYATSCAKVGVGERRWEGIIDAMVKLGADISEKERKMLAKCLSEPTADVKAVCE